MQVLIATLNIELRDGICKLIKDKFNTKSIEIIENYEELNKGLSNQPKIIFIDNRLFIQGIEKSVLSLLGKNISSHFTVNESHIILLSSDKHVFRGLGHLSAAIMTLHYGKSHQNNIQKLSKLINQITFDSKFLHKYQKRKIPIYFVHGFSGSQGTWRSLVELIKLDDELKDLFEIGYYNYPTFTFSPLKLFTLFNPRKYDSLENNAKSLETLLKDVDSEKFILVGHSLGGLIIRMFLLDFFAKKYRGRIKKILLYAPANNGSSLASFLSTIYRKNLHLKILKYENDYLNDLNEKWKLSGIENSVDITAIVGLRDKTIRTTSAVYGLKEKNIYYFNDKNHLSIKNPGSADSAIFLNFKKQLLKPML